MCRIAGIADKSKPMELLKQQVEAMCDLQKHGGPDDAGMYECADGNIVLGHRRLALIDLSAAGHQPMCYEDRYIISFNGEIYNYPELKTELQKAGQHFSTHSDTEVILAAFARWNTQSFTKLSGMYAFALYDTKEGCLYLVRDPSGIKPLYYCVTSTSVEFASEIRAFSVLKKKEDPHWPVFQLAYGHLPEPVTTLREVKPLHKGFFYKYHTATGTSSLQSFSHYSYSSGITGVDAAKASIRAALEPAVRRHLLSDAPIGVFLSGGIDSGIVTALASFFQKKHLQTLSLYFNEETFSEKKFQDIFIRKYQCGSHQHLLTSEEFNENFPGILAAMDMPTCDGINTWFISKYAKEQGLKAVLSGIGGDELFGGYPSFRRIAMAWNLQQLNGAVLRTRAVARQKKLKRLSYLSLGGTTGLYLFLRGIFTIGEIARYLGTTEKEVQFVLRDRPILPVLDTLHHKDKAGWLELNMYLQNQLLRDADVMGMAHGVEIRVPFLDKEVINTAMSIDPAVKYGGRLPKQILIDSFKRELPEATWNRKKMGFGFPFAEWMSTSTFVSDAMAGAGQRSCDAFARFRSGNMHWSQLLSLLLLQQRGINN